MEERIRELEEKEKSLMTQSVETCDPLAIMAGGFYGLKIKKRWIKMIFGGIFGGILKSHKFQHYVIKQ